MSEEEKEEALKQRRKEEKKRKNANKKYDHPDEKPMGRDPLGADERRVNGRDWGDSPLKLESDLAKLDSFLQNRKSDQPTQNKTNMSKLITEEQDSEVSESKESYLDDKNIIEK